jgi:2-hydroxycyclohexanecarboxyl-CoA dehydrogenase
LEVALSSPLDGRRAFITGGAKGIGAAIAQRFAAGGASVTICDIDMHAADELARRIGISAVALNVSDIAAVRRVILKNGPFDILVNNAGIDQHAFFTDTTPEEWRQLIAVNLEAVLACTHASLPPMQSAGFGRIINIASEAGRLGSRGGAVYAAAKGGVIAFTKSIARENARYGITANVIAPGPIQTPMLSRAIKLGGSKVLDAMKSATQLKRLGEPDDVAAAALFLASHEASYITGETLGVSGGMGIGA